MVALERLAPEIINFVMARRREGGGFAAAPTLPSSIEDTYFALRILETLQPFSEDELVALGRDRGIREYLMKMEDRGSWSPKTTFRHLMACRIAGIDPDETWIRRFVSSETNKDYDRSDPYYIKRILKEGFAEPVQPPGRFETAGYLARRRTVEELWMALYLVEGNPELILSDREALISWLHACQNPDGGFGFMPGTTSFMGNNYYSLRCLRLLKARPSSEGDVLRFVLRSQGKRGGFARRNGATPFLDATWHAVATMDLLVSLHRMDESRSQAGG
jgi:prenyltransferase beta subunit